ncbi:MULTISPECIES: tyrosine-type recombinase/integrase [Paenibacillus]|uniref:tyrosine-type recombinase/integrase n=1 Tax=Paenibacillus TaxID=44249 RepID=UPI002E0E16D9
MKPYGLYFGFKRILFKLLSFFRWHKNAPPRNSSDKPGVYSNVYSKGCTSYHDQGFIFARVGKFAGYPQVIKMVELRMKRLLKLAGLNPDLTPHSLRHTHTSLLAEAEATLEQIMQRLGHANDEITRRIYLHITKPKRKEAAQKFSELMRASKKSDQS